MTVEQLIWKIKKSTQHRYLYHFTDEANIPSIRAKGILSKQRMWSRRMWPPSATGGNKLSHDLDARYGIDEYVSLCMTKDHKMSFVAKKNGRLPNLRHLAILPEVLRIAGTRIAFGIANSNDAEILPVHDALEYLDTEVIYERTNWSDPSVQARLQSARKLEVLVPNVVPARLIARVF